MKKWSMLFAFCFLLVFVGFALAADPGVTEQEILVGTSSPLEGATSYLGIQTNHGFMAHISAVNDAGGVNGRKIKVISYNDGYEPGACMEKTIKLILNDKVFCLANYVGTPTSLKAQQIWTSNKVPVVGFFTGAEGLRTPFNRYNFHIRGSYYQETAAIVDAFVKELKLTKIAIFYQNDAFGEAVKKGTELALEKHGLVPVAYGTFERNTLTIKEGLDKIIPANPEAIVIVGTYAPLAKFVKVAKRDGLTKVLFHTVSFVGPEAFAKELGEDVSNVIITQVMPPYQTAKAPIVKEYLETLPKYYPDDTPNSVSLEGFADARVLVEGLKRAGKDLTRESFINALESIQPGQMGTGLKIDYGPDDHVAMDKIYITRIVNGKFEEITDWSSVKPQ